MKIVSKFILSILLTFIFSSGYAQAKPEKAKMKIQNKIEKSEAIQKLSKTKDSASKKKNKTPKLKLSSKAVIDSSKVKKKSKTKVQKTKAKPKLMMASKKKN